MVIFRCIILCSILFWWSISFAAPVITAISSGIVTHGTALTLTGTDFGTKASANPDFWDTLEDKACNTTATIGTWGAVGNLVIDNTETPRCSPRSSYQATYTFVANVLPAGAGNFAGGSDSAKWFAGYWFKLKSPWTWGTSVYGDGDEHLANVKFFRLAPAAYGTNPNNLFLQWDRTTYYKLAIERCMATMDQKTDIIPSNITEDAWHHLQFQYSESSALDVADGTFKWWYDGTEMSQSSGTTFITRCTGANYGNSFRIHQLGFNNSWEDDGTDSNYFFIDDAYADNEWSRIEIGDNIDYGSCTHREMQIASAWADTSITFNLNQGSFSTGNGIYVFVSDSSGNISAGYGPYYIGSSTISAPIPPSGETGGAATGRSISLDPSLGVSTRIGN